MISIILCDDNEIELKEYAEKIESHLNNNQEYGFTIRCYSSGITLDFELEDSGRADLYLLDIDMPGVNGIQIAKRIQVVYPNAIVYFITSHLEYATEGYRVEARRYLIKGGDERYLNEAIDYACEKIISLQKDYISFSSYHDTTIILVTDIMYVVREKRRLIVHTYPKVEIAVNENIQSLYKRISYPNFIFINRGTIINIDYVRRTNQNTVIMLDGKELEISRMKIKEIKNEIAKHWQIR